MQLPPSWPLHPERLTLSGLGMNLHVNFTKAELWKKSADFLCLHESTNCTNSVGVD